MASMSSRGLNIGDDDIGQQAGEEQEGKGAMLAVPAQGRKALLMGSPDLPAAASHPPSASLCWREVPDNRAYKTWRFSRFAFLSQTLKEEMFLLSCLCHPPSLDPRRLFFSLCLHPQTGHLPSYPDTCPGGVTKAACVG